jgi:hypothetical protein
MPGREHYLAAGFRGALWEIQIRLKMNALFQYTRTIRNCGSLLQAASVSVFV